MSPKMSLFAARSLLALAYCTIVLAIVHAAETSDSPPKQPESYMGKMMQRVSDSSARVAANIMASYKTTRLMDAKQWRVLDFKQFQLNFGRHYTSSLEETWRQSLFSARVLEAAKSAWRYVSHKSETYNSINSRSDMTPEEREELRSQRPKRLMDDTLLKSGKIVVMADPDKQRVTASRGGSADALGSLVGGLFSALPTPSPPPPAKTTGMSWYSRFTGGALGGSTTAATTAAATPSLPSKDLRRSKCFFPPGDQGRCESCASFVAMAQLEFLYCRETKQLVKFSEQFPLDCGSPFGMLGCRGTDVASLNQFIATAGLERAEGYSYSGAKVRCPYYSKLTRTYDWAQAGDFKLRHVGSVAAPRTSWSKYLDRAIPLHVGVLTSDAFEDYGGGVASTCSQSSGAHGMLLVGEGRDNGNDYWLLRNSYGTTWGEEGYFRLSKRATHCFSDEGRGYFQQAFLQSMGDSFVPNKRHQARYALTPKTVN